MAVGRCSLLLGRSMAAPDNAANSAARLGGRIACNQRYARGFLDFVLQMLELDRDDAVLDLGPGLGSQLVPVAARVRRAVGVDVSPELIAALRASTAGANVTLVEGDMDALAALDLETPFNLAYAVYSLHYSRDPAAVLRAVDALLDGPRARCVVVTPDSGNNAGWFADLGRLYAVDADALAVAHLGRRIIVPAFRTTFARVECTTFHARAHFPTVDAVMAYYDASAPYCRPDRRDEVQRYFAAIIDRDGGYTIDKHSLAIVGRKHRP